MIDSIIVILTSVVSTVDTKAHLTTGPSWWDSPEHSILIQPSGDTRGIGMRIPIQYLFRHPHSHLRFYKSKAHNLLSQLTSTSTLLLLLCRDSLFPIHRAFCVWLIGESGRPSSSGESLWRLAHRGYFESIQQET